jgi:serine/threonine protein kinase
MTFSKIQNRLTKIFVGCWVHLRIENSNDNSCHFKFVSDWMGFNRVWEWGFIDYETFIESIGREASIFKTVRHPFILQFRQLISDTSDHNSAIVTAFIKNGSLASHLPWDKSSDKCHLRGANRIVRIIVGMTIRIESSK